MKKITFIRVLLLVASLLPVCRVRAQDTLTNGLVAFYPFNGNANDASGNGFNPSVVNATPCPDRFGNPNQAYYFDGVDNYIGFPNVPLTEFSSWTLAVWIQPASLDQSGYVINMGYDDGSTGNGFGLCVGDGAGGNGGQLGGVIAEDAFFSGGYVFANTNQWHHVVMLDNAGMINFYVDGVLTPNSFSGSPQRPTDFTIGSATGHRFYNGAINDVCIYNRALSAAEVLLLFADDINGQNNVVVFNQPVSIFTNQNATVSFSVTAYSTTPLTYQWQFNGTNLFGATNSVLNITNVQFSNAGLYDVDVANSSNSVTSVNAYLGIAIPGAPAIFVNSNLVNVYASAVGAATITMNPGFTNGLIVYTVTGDAESGDPQVYDGPFTVTNSVNITAVDYSDDFSESAQMQPLALQIIPVYTLTTSVVGGGIISVNPDTNTFASNSVVTLTASTGEFWVFDHWQGDLTNHSNPLTITINTNLSLQAVFISAPLHLTLATSGGGAVQASGQTTDGVHFPTNSLITLSAANYPGWTFLGWQGDITNSANPCTVVITHDLNIQGVFGTPVLTNAVGDGQIVLSTANPVPCGSSVMASAVAGNGDYFVAWGGALSGTQSPASTTNTVAYPTIDALFLPLPASKLALSVAVLGNGTATISPQKSYYNPGDTVALSAQPDSLAGTFYGWFGGVNSTNSTVILTLNTNVVVYADFAGLPPPTPAAAYAIINAGACGPVVLTSGGYGYTNLPVVTLVGGGGSGATATAVVQNGVVAAVNIINAGSGYTNPPQVIIEPPVIQPPEISIAPASLLSFSNLTIANGYILQQSVAQAWENLPGIIQATNTTTSFWVKGTTTAGGYRLVTAPLPSTAIASTITDFGFVVAATVTSGGSGYSAVPAVTITGGGGSGATATATVSNGAVTGIVIENPGSDYTNPPAITIAPPPVPGWYALTQPGIWLGMNNLMTNQLYQLQYAQQLNNAGITPGGNYFITVNTNQSQYFLITNNSGYYQLQYIP